MADPAKQAGRAGAKKRVQMVRTRPTFWWKSEPAFMAFVLTLLLHVGSYEVIPRHLGFQSWDELSPEERQRRRSMQFRVRFEQPPEELVPVAIPVRPDPPEQFVQSNTDSPDNPPDETPFFSNRDQQAAQPDKPEELSIDETPSLDGDAEDSLMIISGDGREVSVEKVAVSLPTQGQRPQEFKPGRDNEDRAGDSDVELSPPALPKSSRLDPADGEGIGRLMDPGEAETAPPVPTSEKLIPAVMTPDVVEARHARRQRGQEAVAPVPADPKPRPRLTVTLRDSSPLPTVLAKRPAGVNTTGNIAYSAKFSEYGDYLARMFEVIGNKWQDLNSYTRASVDDTRAFVLVRFYINKQGEVEDLDIIETNASQIAQWRCIDAIKANAPYFPWTADMVRVLGERQPVVVKFHYW